MLDRYSIEGSAPEVAAVFPYSVEGKLNLFVIVAWQVQNRGVGTYGTLYQVYAYGDDGAGGLTSNPIVASAAQMTGIEGVADGEPSHFDGKTADEVKKLIDRIHLK